MQVVRKKEVCIKEEQDKKTYKEICYINNQKMSMFYVTKNNENPVILFLHGGPGSPEYIFFQSQINGSYFENYTICYFEQRGSGMSKAKKDVLNVSDMINDIKIFSQYLQEKFSQKKIILMGHSWGSYLGIEAIKQFPYLYHCYVGVSQLVNIKKSERELYPFFETALLEKKAEKLTSELKKYDIENEAFPSIRYLSKTKTKILKILQGSIRKNNVIKNSFSKQFIKFKGYTVVEKIQLLLGMLLSGNTLIPQMEMIDISKKITAVTVPILFVHGSYDYQISGNLAKGFYNQLDAPLKGYHVFEQSAHFPHIEEAALFSNIVDSFIKKCS